MNKISINGQSQRRQPVARSEADLLLHQRSVLSPLLAGMFGKLGAEVRGERGAP